MEVSNLSQSLDRALHLLRLLAFTFHGQNTSLKDLSDRANLSPSTAYRLLTTMMQHSMVSQDPDSRMYRLGPDLIAMGMVVRQNLNLRQVALTVMRELTQITGEDSYLAVPDQNDGYFTEVVEGSNPLKIVESIGSRVPLHCGAIRKVLLAHMGEAFIDQYLSRELARFSKSTVVDPADLRMQLADIRTRGYAVTRGEYIPGAVGIGAVVRDHTGQAVASVGIIAPEVRFKADSLKRCVRAVRQAAADISLRIGYVQPLSEAGSANGL